MLRDPIFKRQCSAQPSRQLLQKFRHASEQRMKRNARCGRVPEMRAMPHRLMRFMPTKLSATNLEYKSQW